MKHWFYLLTLMLTISMGACSSNDFLLEEESLSNNESKITNIIAVIGSFDTEDFGSRTTITMGESTIDQPVWAENDSIGIYPIDNEKQQTNGDQLSFRITNGIGTSICAFDGGGWGLKNSQFYCAYTPFNRAYYYKEVNELPVSMLGQKQKGNGSTAHMGKYDLQIAIGRTPENGKVNFQFQHQVCFLRMDLTAPIAATWKSITLESNASFTTEAVMNLASSTPTVTPISTSNQITLELENVTTTSEDLSIVAYMMLLPVNLTNKTLNIILTDNEGNTYATEASITSANHNFGAAKARWITANFEKIPYVTFSADAEQTLTMSKAVATLEYSVNGDEWKELGTNTITFGGENGILQLRGKNINGTATGPSTGSNISFGNDTPVVCTGDIRTLLNYTDYLTVNTSNARFCTMFMGCKVLVSAPELPATTLATYCYAYMFLGCSNLTSAPKLPATVLASSCYLKMFETCKNLKSAPELPALALAVGCYESMFAYCNNLDSSPVLPATTLSNGCYHSMFLGCTKLITAPLLPAKVLTSSCYQSMFRGCKNLNNITMLATNIEKTLSLSGWLENVASEGTFIKAKEMESLPIGTSGIPNGWTAKNYGEE